MIKCTCLSKIRDNNGKIVTYCLQDGQGNIQNMDSDILKNGIRAKQIDVVNLTLTSDNRLVDKNIIKMSDDRIQSLRKSRSTNDLGTRYQNLFAPAGIEVVSAMYLAYPTPQDTLETLYNKSFGSSF